MKCKRTQDKLSETCDRNSKISYSLQWIERMICTIDYDHRNWQAASQHE